MPRSRGVSSQRTNRCVQSWQSALCEVARHKARGDADREGNRLHRDGFAPRRKPCPRTHSISFPFAGAAPLRRASDRPSGRAAPHSQPLSLSDFLPRHRYRDYHPTYAPHIASAALRVRHALTCAARQPVKWAERLVRRSSTSERGSDTHPMHQFVTGTRSAFWFCLSQAIARRAAVAPFPCPSFARPQSRKP